MMPAFHEDTDEMMFRRFLKDRTGATAIEYGLILAVLSLTIIGGIGTAGNALEALWADNNSKLNQGLGMGG
jgi:pilus assembly protein Flp/PilA